MSEDLVSMLSRASVQDLRDMQQRIDKLTREVREFAEARKAEIASLRIVRRILEKKLLPPKTHKPRVARSAVPPKVLGAEHMTALQTEIYDLIAKEGSMPVPAIAARINKTPISVSVCISRCEWFDSSHGEVRIAKTKATA